MVEYRNVKESDLASITDITNRSRKGLPYWRDKSPGETAAETFKDEHYDPAGAWLVLADGEAIAYGEAFIDRGKVELGKKEGSVRAEVVPELRERGIEEEILARSERYLRDRGMAIAQSVSNGKDAWRMRLLETSRYRMVRRFHIMVMKTASLRQPLTVPLNCRLDNILMADATDRDIELLAEVFSDSFKEHFGYAPMPPSRLVNFRDSAQDVFLLTYAYAGDECVGICLTEDSVLLNQKSGTRGGWINILGVRKCHRRHGIGTAMIVEGVKWLAGRGLDTVHIAVDVENPRALSLYKSLGLDVENENLAYWKDLV